MRVLVMVAALAACLGAGNGSAAENEPNLRRLFHLVGVPDVPRDARIDLEEGADALIFRTKKVSYQVPFVRLRRVLLLRANRRYEGATYAAAVATFGVGGLLILKKHPVDTAVLDYVNERNGKMGIVVQMERAQGELFSDLLKRKGIPVNEPEAADATDRSKP
ncbi:MAG TPA: hypothetical protein VMJ34_03215 [Bryobacteraceae bacterium]|nr:hypothetical protein [Bryobacteraceae bacterium]